MLMLIYRLPKALEEGKEIFSLSNELKPSIDAFKIRNLDFIAATVFSQL